MFYTIHTGTHFKYLKPKAVLYIGKFNSHLTESKLSLLQKPISKLILYREIIAVCSEIHTKHVNTLCGAECKNSQ